MESPVKPVVIFMHIPKTAGNTMLKILYKQYEWGTEIHSTYPFEELPKMGLPNSNKCIIGHNQFGIHRNLNRPFQYITFLRNPVERVISEYYFTLPYHHLSFEKYLDFGYDYKNYNPNEMQTRWATGQNTINLELAKSNLSTYFPIIGITERFAESVFLMKKQFGWGDISYQKQNITPNRPSVKEIELNIIDKILKRNTFDLQLYQWATKLFDKQLDLLSQREKLELATFKTSIEN
jgi:hypothetical protein